MIWVAVLVAAIAVAVLLDWMGLPGSPWVVFIFASVLLFLVVPGILGLWHRVRGGEARDLHHAQGYRSRVVGTKDERNWWRLPKERHQGTGVDGRERTGRHTRRTAVRVDPGPV